MSVFEHSSSSAREISGHRTPRVTVAQLFLRAVRRWQRSRAINELGRLNDGQLKDIGISRNDIPRVVDGLFNPEEVKTSGQVPLSEPEEGMRKAA